MPLPSLWGLQSAKILNARESFWEYCRLKSPDFYKDDRVHLYNLCNTLEKLYRGELLKEDGTAYKKIIVEMPPQHGKTRTLTNLCQWILGNNNEERIIVGSYNDDTASDFSRYTRDGITEEKFNPDNIVFSDIFPDTKIKHGNSSYQKWALDGQHFNYLAAGIGGSVTSKGATLLLIDDLIKGAIEALNAGHLDKVWTWYTSTFLSRVSAQGGEPLEIFVMTPWSKLDPIGRILDGVDSKDWYRLQMPAYDKENDKMLCADILGKARYLFLKRIQVPEIFAANYDLERVDVQGRLYKNLKTYSELPQKDGKLLIREIKNYTDVADQGKDYLCSINYAVYDGSIYIIDVYYTKAGAEETEIKTAEMLIKDNVRMSDIESNNGGRFFARNLNRILKEKKHFSTVIKWFHQSQNKIARIVGASALVQENVYFPVNWKDRWPEYYKAMTTFLKDGKNAHDDAPDATTGVVEKSLMKKQMTFA